MLPLFHTPHCFFHVTIPCSEVMSFISVFRKTFSVFHRLEYSTHLATPCTSVFHTHRNPFSFSIPNTLVDTCPVCSVFPASQASGWGCQMFSLRNEGVTGFKRFLYINAAHLKVLIGRLCVEQHKIGLEYDFYRASKAILALCQRPKGFGFESDACQRGVPGREKSGNLCFWHVVKSREKAVIRKSFAK